MHGSSLPQSLVQRLDVDAAGYEVGQQQEEVKTLQTWVGDGKKAGNILFHMNDADLRTNPNPCIL